MLLMAKILRGFSPLPVTTTRHPRNPRPSCPNPKNGETSVFRHGGKPLEELKTIAQAEVGAVRRTHSAAIVQGSVIREAKLEVRAKEPPPPRHADIVGWPWSKDDPDFGKAEQKGLAALIAQNAGSLLRFS